MILFLKIYSFAAVVMGFFITLTDGMDEPRAAAGEGRFRASLLIAAAWPIFAGLVAYIVVKHWDDQ